MASIEQEIRDAVPQMLARDAERDYGARDPHPAGDAAVQAYRAIKWAIEQPASKPLDRYEVLDCMNLCALALSLLPDHKEADGG